MSDLRMVMTNSLMIGLAGLLSAQCSLFTKTETKTDTVTRYETPLLQTFPESCIEGLPVFSFGEELYQCDSAKNHYVTANPAKIPDLVPLAPGEIYLSRQELPERCLEEANYILVDPVLYICDSETASYIEDSERANKKLVGTDSGAMGVVFLIPKLDTHTSNVDDSDAQKPEVLATLETPVAEEQPTLPAKEIEKVYFFRSTSSSVSFANAKLEEFGKLSQKVEVVPSSDGGHKWKTGSQGAILTTDQELNYEMINGRKIVERRDLSQMPEFVKQGISGCVPLEPAGRDYLYDRGNLQFYRAVSDNNEHNVNDVKDTDLLRPLGFCLQDLFVYKHSADDKVTLNFKLKASGEDISEDDELFIDYDQHSSGNGFFTTVAQPTETEGVYEVIRPLMTKAITLRPSINDRKLAVPVIVNVKFKLDLASETKAVEITAATNLCSGASLESDPFRKSGAMSFYKTKNGLLDVKELDFYQGNTDYYAGESFPQEMACSGVNDYAANAHIWSAPAHFIIEDIPSVDPSAKPDFDGFMKECNETYEAAISQASNQRVIVNHLSESENDLRHRFMTLEIMRSRLRTVAGRKLPEMWGGNGEVRIDNLRSDLYTKGSKTYCRNIFANLALTDTLNLMNGSDTGSKDKEANTTSRFISESIYTMMGYAPKSIRVSRNTKDTSDLSSLFEKRLLVKEIDVLRHFKHLRNLVLKDNEIGGAEELVDLSALSSLKNLETLDLSRRLYIENESLEATGFSALDESILGRVEPVEHRTYDLKGIEGLARLVRLDLTNQRVSDKSLLSVGKLVSLRQLDLNWTSVDAAGGSDLGGTGELADEPLKPLANLKNLEILKLNGRASTSVRNFNALKDLQRLRIVGVTHDEAIEYQLPEVRVGADGENIPTILNWQQKPVFFTYTHVEPILRQVGWSVKEDPPTRYTLHGSERD